MKRILLFGTILALLKAVDAAGGQFGTGMSAAVVGLLIVFVSLVALATDPFLNDP